MKKSLTVGIVFFSILFINSYASECKIKVQKGDKWSPGVILASGNAYQLLDGYMRELKKNNIEVKSGDLEVEISWKDGLSGKSVQEIWKSKVAEHEAKVEPQELAKAERTGYDIYCISTETTATKLSNCPLAYTNLSNPYLLNKNYNLSLDTYKKGVELAGDDGFLHFTGAIVYTQRKDYDYAIQSLEKALRSDFSDKSLLTNGEMRPLIKEKRKDFCSLLDTYKSVCKQTGLLLNC